MSTGAASLPGREGPAGAAAYDIEAGGAFGTCTYVSHSHMPSSMSGQLMPAEGDMAILSGRASPHAPHIQHLCSTCLKGGSIRRKIKTNAKKCCDSEQYPCDVAINRSSTNGRSTGVEARLGFSRFRRMEAS